MKKQKRLNNIVTLRVSPEFDAELREASRLSATPMSFLIRQAVALHLRKLQIDKRSVEKARGGLNAR